MIPYWQAFATAFVWSVVSGYVMYKHGRATGYSAGLAAAKPRRVGNRFVRRSDGGFTPKHKPIIPAVTEPTLPRES